MPLPTLVDLLQGLTLKKRVRGVKVPKQDVEEDVSVDVQPCVLSKKELEFYEILVSLGGKASTADLSRRVLVGGSNTVYHMRKLERKGKVEEVGRSILNSSIPTIFWQIK